MSEEDFRDEMLELAQISARAASLGLRLNIQRFWSEEMAKPRYADPKRLLRYGAKVPSLTMTACPPICAATRLP